MTRREFLASSALLLRRDAPPVRTIEALPVRYPVTGYFRFFTKPERPAVFVKISCEDGTAGWGQSVPIPTWSYETLESVTGTIRQYLAPPLIGMNPTDVAEAHRRMNRAIAPSFSTGMPIAKSGIDMALWDAKGKALNLPLYKLLGGAQQGRGVRSRRTCAGGQLGNVPRGDGLFPACGDDLSAFRTGLLRTGGEQRNAGALRRGAQAAGRRPERY